MQRRRELVALAAALKVVLDELRRLVDRGAADEVVLLELPGRWEGDAKGERVCAERRRARGKRVDVGER